MREFLYLAQSYRVVNMFGHYGSGKTLLAVHLAMEFWKRGIVEKIYTNFPCVGAEIEYVENDKNFVMVLDEAHVVIDSRAFSKQASQTWLKDLRKRKSILLVPAVLSVDKRFRSLAVARIMAVGNLAWVYRWQIDDGVGEHSGTFILWKPYQYFGAYDTEYIPTDEDFQNIMKVMAEGANSNPGTEAWTPNPEWGQGQVIEVDDGQKLRKRVSTEHRRIAFAKR